MQKKEGKHVEDFTQKVLTYIQAIPEGRVATYGQIAKLAGNPKAARQVSRFLHTMTNKYDLPWHRIINAQGKIMIADPERQIALLEAEGIEVLTGNRVNLKQFQWDPDMYDYWMNG